MKKVIILLTLACFIAPQLAFGGAWTLPKNNVWAEWYTKYHWEKWAFGSDRDPGKIGGPEKDARGWGWSFIPKVEYGVTDWFTLIGAVEGKTATYKEYVRPASWGPWSKTSSALTNFEVGARIRALEKPVVLSGQIKGMFYTGYGYNKNPQLCDGDDALDMRVIVSKKFDTKIPFYVSGELGYRLKNRRVCDEVPAFVEIGFWPSNWLLIKSEIDAVWGLNGTGALATEEDRAIWRIGPAIELLEIYDMIINKFTKRSPKDDSEAIIYSVTRGGRSLTLAAQYGLTFWGRNTDASQEVVVKISTQF